MQILQVVGYKNSGKTTISESIISYFTGKGIKVGSLKNHGHGGTPQGFEATDSERHRQAGAVIAGVKGDQVFQLTQTNEWKLADMLVMYQYLGVELLLLEGFKRLDYPKIVLVKTAEDVHLLNDLTNIIGIVKQASVSIREVEIPIFDRTNQKKICRWLYHQYGEWEQA
ncbi:molybdopterin-guanine dinucleotide biosynthesis protein B [Ornithinibacillus contaminans]|uniref:molybdopterin-guanine dinucleotide biosynthesis protein B n=1 Tax=Ornithinibacillus contaminans TaxID=694055 RepID=UPI00064DD3DF|nr:molybdopterin-guanine dinucleotide biosynthesis protein B [Ornithinibacillus contaminans]